MSTLTFKDWAANYKDFLTDSQLVRRASAREKDAYFKKFNEDLSGKFQSLEANFQIWANLFSAIHPSKGTKVNLTLSQTNRKLAKKYATAYEFIETHVRTPAVGCVWHYLEPAAGTEDPDNPLRAILLFRGTTTNPATYHSESGLLHTEPLGAYADGNFTGVSSFSFRLIRKELDVWMSMQSKKRRQITFIGFSLGGSLAMRSIDYYVSRKFLGWEESELYAFSSPGLRRRHADRLHKSIPYEQLHTFWHVDDWVVKVGFYPRTQGREFSQDDRTAPTELVKKAAECPKEPLSEVQRHGYPFIALEEVWVKHLAFSKLSMTGEPNVSSLARASLGFMRAIPYGIFGTMIIAGGVGANSLRKKGFSVFGRQQNKHDRCGHKKH